MPQVNPRLISPAFLVTTIVVWGYNWIPMKISLAGAGPFTMTALRVGLGALTLLIVLAALRRPLGPPRERTYLWLGLTQVMGMVGLSSIALSLGDVGRTAILLFTMPLWTILLARVVLAERIGPARWAGMALALGGIATIVSGGHLDGAALLGATCSILGGLCWAAGVIIQKRAGRAPDLLRLTAWQQIVGFVPSLVIALAAREHAIVWTPVFSVAILFNGIVGSGLAWLTWLGAVSRLPASLTAIASLGIPVVATVAAALQLGELPPGRELAGDALILAGLIVAIALGSGSIAGTSRRRAESVT